MDIYDEFLIFIREFVNEEGVAVYEDKIREMRSSGARSLLIDFHDLEVFNPDLADELIQYPEYFLKEAARALKDYIIDWDPEFLETLEERVHVRVHNLDDTSKLSLREVKSQYLGKLVVIDGIITRMSEVKPMLNRARFLCVACQSPTSLIQQEEGRYTPPYQCENPECNSKGPFKLMRDESEFIDWQSLTMQERPEDLPPGQLPQSLGLVALDDVVDLVRPGDRVRIIGILKARIPGTLQRGKLATFTRYIEIVWIENESDKVETIEITEEDEQKIFELARDPMISQKIRDSLAPSIYGHDLIKEAICLLLFGGSPKKTHEGLKIRGESNILLIGDPGAGKSQLLKLVANLAPRALYTSGKGVSAAGLCVSGDSDIMLATGPCKIGDLVESQFQEVEVHRFDEIHEYCIPRKELRVYHLDAHMKVGLGRIERLWRIKAPRQLIRITTTTGKVLAVTPETKLLALDSVLGAKWEPARFLKVGDRIATMSLHVTKNNQVNVKNVATQDLATLLGEDASSGQESGWHEAKLEHFRKLTEEADVSWDEIESMEVIVPDDEYVYDVTVAGTHNFVANGVVVHNTAAVIRDSETGELTLEAGALVLADQGIALIDEFDKMRPEDRAAIHEAMEQHSYHPSTEITLADGTIVKIGEYVDQLFKEHEDAIVRGVNCEILPLHEDVRVLSTDFKTINSVRINRVSRHDAPEYFFRISFSNGRSIIVTPEHPVYVHDFGIKTIPASELKKGTYVPAPRVVKYEHRDAFLKTPINSGKNPMTFPRKMTRELASFLGYFVASGYFHEGQDSINIDLSTSNADVVADVINVIQNLFSVESVDYTKQHGVIQVISRPLLNYLTINFPEMMKPRRYKRIPRIIFSCSEEVRTSFLRCAFIGGNGSIETNTCAYTTTSEGLARDYQDLLLTLGIHGRLDREQHYNGKKKNKKTRCQYKVSISEESLEQFVVTVIPSKITGNMIKKWLKLNALISKNRRRTKNLDELPKQATIIIKECLRDLGLINDAHVQHLFVNGDRLSVEEVKQILVKLKRRLQALKTLPVTANVGTSRKISGVSPSHPVKGIDTLRNDSSYREGEETFVDAGLSSRSSLTGKFEEHLENVHRKINHLEQLCQFKWLRVTSIEKILNAGTYRTKWVYDVTIEPTRNFLSHGLVLHNTISIAKAGIVATLNARTSVLAAANPRYGRWNPLKELSQNINLPPTILSRFDLIFVLRDVPDHEEDQRKASHILDLHMKQGEELEPPIPRDLLRKYIAYARANMQPRLTPEAKNRLLEFYLSLRDKSARAQEMGPGPIAITARQLESLVRLAEARAKMHLREEVTEEDAAAAIRLMEATLTAIALDPETGLFDVDTITSGVSSRTRSKMERFNEVIDRLSEEMGAQGFSLEDILKQPEIAGIDPQEIERWLEELAARGQLFEPRPGRYSKA